MWASDQHQVEEDEHQVEEDEHQVEEDEHQVVKKVVMKDLASEQVDQVTLGKY